MIPGNFGKDDDLLRVFDRLCGGDAGPEAVAELQLALRNHPDAAQQFLNYMAMHADIYGVVRLSRVRKIVECEVNASDIPVAHASWNWKLARFVAPVLAIAAMLLVGLVLVNRDESAGVTLKWPNAVAALKRVEDVAWTESAKTYEVDGILTVGDVLQVESGLLEIEFRDGAVVVLEGPAQLVTLGGNHANLLSGQLAAFAPPWAKGFRVDTPGLGVIDHGTRFAVRVDTTAAKPAVDVMVAEGEVELLEEGESTRGRRLFAGQGVRSGGGDLNQALSDDALKLVAELPKEAPGLDVVIAGDRWHDWQPGADGQPNRQGPWRYFTNVNGPFGDPSFYEELLWNSSSIGFFAPPGVTMKQPHESLGFVKVHRDGGHPGRGKSQSTDGLDHYSITGFVVPQDGVYRIEAGWLERPEPRRWDLDHVLDIAVHVNNQPVVMREFCNHDCFMRFSVPLGKLHAGDVIYVGVGPSGVDFNDRFRWGFNVVREVAPAAAKKESVIPRDETIGNGSQAAGFSDLQSKHLFFERSLTCKF